jgi:hypothetical protein
VQRANPLPRNRSKSRSSAALLAGVADSQVVDARNTIKPNRQTPCARNVIEFRTLKTWMNYPGVSRRHRRMSTASPVQRSNPVHLQFGGRDCARSTRRSASRSSGGRILHPWRAAAAGLRHSRGPVAGRRAWTAPVLWRLGCGRELDDGGNLVLSLIRLARKAVEDYRSPRRFATSEAAGNSARSSPPTGPRLCLKYVFSVIAARATMRIGLEAAGVWVSEGRAGPSRRLRRTSLPAVLDRAFKE